MALINIHIFDFTTIINNSHNLDMELYFPVQYKVVLIFEFWRVKYLIVTNNICHTSKMVINLRMKF